MDQQYNGDVRPGSSEGARRATGDDPGLIGKGQQRFSARRKVETVLRAVICIVSPVLGLRPVRSARSFTENTPDRNKVSRPSVCKLAVITEIRAG